jgi:hypothetical protein
MHFSDSVMVQQPWHHDGWLNCNDLVVSVFYYHFESCDNAVMSDAAMNCTIGCCCMDKGRSDHRTKHPQVNLVLSWS